MRIEVLHAARQFPAWLIFDVGQRMSYRVLILVTVVLSSFAQSACTRDDPRHMPVSSPTASAYSRWRMGASDIRPEEWREFDAMLQELRLRIMANREATGREGIESALRGKIDGTSFHEVLIMGFEAKVERLAAEREQVRRVMGGNARLSVVLGGSEFERTRADQEKRLLAIDEEIRTAKRRVADLRGSPKKPNKAPEPTPGTVTPRAIDPNLK